MSDSEQLDSLKDYVHDRTSVSDLKRELYRHACADTATHILTDHGGSYTAVQVENKYALLNWVLIRCRPHPGAALEFGIGDKPKSLDIIAHHRSGFGPVYAFDSFEGLPEDWRSGFPKGTFRPSNNPLDALQHRSGVQVYKGWFADTVKEFVAQSRTFLDADGIAFIHIDSDLYQSAYDVLYGLAGWIFNQPKQVYILFDEYWNYPGWRNGEYLAWQEIAPEKGWKIVAYDTTGEGVVIKVESQ